jgi:hypothetical protein
MTILKSVNGQRIGAIIIIQIIIIYSRLLKIYL